MKKLLIIIILSLFIFIGFCSITSAATKLDNCSITAIEANTINKVTVKIIDSNTPYTIISIGKTEFFVNRNILMKHLEILISSSRNKEMPSNNLFLDNTFIYNDRFNKHEIFIENDMVYLFLYKLIDDYVGETAYLKIDFNTTQKLLKIIS